MLDYDIKYYLNRYKRAAIITGAVLLVMAVFAIIIRVQIVNQQQKGKIAVPMNIVPSSAKVTLDGKEKLSGSTVYITPGKHTIEVNKDGFKGSKRDYFIESYNNPAIYIGLTGESESAKKWQDQNPNKYMRLERLAGEQAKAYSIDFNERNPIVKKLPFKDPYFTISYRAVDDKSVYLVIWGTSPRYREFAIDYIRKLGFEPTDYIVKFEDFKNPLEVSS